MKTFIQRHCFKCLHDWIQRGKKAPKVCPKCKNTNWNTGIYAYDSSLARKSTKP